MRWLIGCAVVARSLNHQIRLGLLSLAGALLVLLASSAVQAGADTSGLSALPDDVHPNVIDDLMDIFDDDDDDDEGGSDDSQDP